MKKTSKFTEENAKLAEANKRYDQLWDAMIWAGIHDWCNDKGVPFYDAAVEAWLEEGKGSVEQIVDAFVDRLDSRRRTLEIA